MCKAIEMVQCSYGKSRYFMVESELQTDSTMKYLLYNRLERFSMTSITSKDRILAAVDHRTSDRTPITFDAEKEVYSLLYDHLNAKTKEELFDKLNVDTW